MRFLLVKAAQAAVSVLFADKLDAAALDYFEARRRKRNVIDYNHSAVAIRKSKRLSRKPTISSR